MATYKGTLKTSNGDILYPATDASKVSGLATVATSGSYNDLTDKPIVIQSKTFTDVIAYSTSDYYKYFGQIIPINWNAVWSIKYRYKITCPNLANCQSTHECLFSGSSGSLLAYSNFNEIKSTSYYPIYYTTLGRETEDSYNAGYGHLLGVYFGSAWNPTSASYKRTFEIEILELINCTFTFFDVDKRASEIGTGFVLNGNTNTDACNQGLRETGDIDTTSLINDNYNTLIMGPVGTGVSTLIGFGADDKMVPILSNNAKAPFKYKNYIYRVSAVEANASLYNISKLVILTYGGISSAAVGANIAWAAGAPIYLKGHISGELFTIDTTTNGGVVFTLPTTEDGYQYYFIGYSCIDRTASQTKYITFTTEHPVYEYINGAIREYVEVAHNADKLNGENASYYLDFNNLANKPTYNFSDINNRYEALITWGGNSISGTVSPLEAGIIDEFAHNKFAYMAGVQVLYSRDAGSTWTNYDATDNAKKALVTIAGASYFYIGGRTGSNNTVDDQLRVILNSNASGGNIYTALKRLLIYISTLGSGGCKVKVEVRTIGNYLDNVDTWSNLGTYDISGWPRWNSIPSSITFGGSSTQTSQFAQIRLTFTVTYVSSSYSNLGVSGIYGIGIPLWASPSTLASTGHLYTYDMNQKATFPATVLATTFNENGTALSNKYLGINATAADSTKLNEQAASYYLDYDNFTNTPDLSTYAHITDIADIKNIPPEVLGLLFYGGTLAGGAVPTATLTEAAKAKLGVTSATIMIAPGGESIHKGIFYRASNNYASFYDNVSFVIGDWIFSDGIKWKNLGQVINSGFYNELHITNMTASGIEAIANKVTSIDEDSSDTQYPSAKCVYDLVGDIATLLADL